MDEGRNKGLEGRNKLQGRKEYSAVRKDDRATRKE